MLRKVDHLKNVDPFYFIRGGGVAHKSDSDAVKARWKEPDLGKWILSENTKFATIHINKRYTSLQINRR